MDNKVILLDVIETLIDIEPVKIKVSSLLGGDYMGDLWFSNMLFYSLVDTLLDDYHDFGKIALASFDMLAKSKKVAYDDEAVMNAIKSINVSPIYDDVKESLVCLKKSGFKLATFTNSSNKAINEQLVSNGIDSYIDEIISTEDIGYFKPHPHTYIRALEIMNVQKEDCMLIASHGWDIAGAKRVGLKTAFLHHDKYSLYPLSTEPNYQVRNLSELIKLICS